MWLPKRKPLRRTKFCRRVSKPPSGSWWYDIVVQAGPARYMSGLLHHVKHTCLCEFACDVTVCVSIAVPQKFYEVKDLKKALKHADAILKKCPRNGGTCRADGLHKGGCMCRHQIRLIRPVVSLQPRECLCEFVGTAELYVPLSR